MPRTIRPGRTSAALPLMDVQASTLGSASWSLPIPTDSQGGEIARFVRIRGRSIAIAGGDGTSTVSLRACGIDNTNLIPPAGDAVAVSLVGKKTYNTPDADVVVLQTGLAETERTITDATNASPIVVTATAHGYRTGDRVRIRGVAGNTAANGDFYVTALTSNTFSLNGSAGNGAYTSGGFSNRFTFWSAMFYLNTDDAQAGEAIPFPFPAVSARLSNSTTAYAATTIGGETGKVYVDDIDLIA